MLIVSFLWLDEFSESCNHCFQFLMLIIMIFYIFVLEFQFSCLPCVSCVLSSLHLCAVWVASCVASPLSHVHRVQFSFPWLISYIQFTCSPQLSPLFLITSEFLHFWLQSSLILYFFGTDCSNKATFLSLRPVPRVLHLDPLHSQHVAEMGATESTWS